MEQLFSRIHSGDGFGVVHIPIVNHATYVHRLAPVKDMSLEQWEGTLRTNLTSSFLVVREYLRRLDKASIEDKDRANIILIGSTAGKHGGLNHADYASSKSAMMFGFLLSLKNEIVKVAPRARINCIAPGLIETPLAEQVLNNPDILYQSLSGSALKKVGTPTDVASQVVVISSQNLSGHVTGQLLYVEGGMDVRLLNSRQDLGLPPA